MEEVGGSVFSEIILICWHMMMQGALAGFDCPGQLFFELCMELASVLQRETSWSIFVEPQPSLVERSVMHDRSSVPRLSPSDSWRPGQALCRAKVMSNGVCYIPRTDRQEWTMDRFSISAVISSSHSLLSEFFFIRT
ncbi:hypothetical protein AMECASPLE_039055 [Ameca splendens]|uniref:Uncharacterized protein n=1 Tax=Ameca splendens TaxID=208324 RepID=A0ABV0Y892_9TELE